MKIGPTSSLSLCLLLFTGCSFYGPIGRATAEGLARKELETFCHRKGIETAEFKLVQTENKQTVKGFLQREFAWAVTFSRVSPDGSIKGVFTALVKFNRAVVYVFRDYENPHTEFTY